MLDAKIGDAKIRCYNLLARVASPDVVFAIFEKTIKKKKKKKKKVKGTRVLYESCNILITKTRHVTLVSFFLTLNEFCCWVLINNLM